MKKLIFENNKVYTLTTFEIPKMKEMLLNLECKYKFKNVFIEKYFNESFAIITLETFYLLLNSLIKGNYMDINFETDITFKEKKAYIKLFINNFYDKNLTEFSKEQLEYLFNTKMNEAEKFIIEEFLKKFPDTETIEEKIELFFKTILNFNDSIKKLKENMDTNISQKEQITYLNMGLLKELFGTNFILIVTQNKLLEEEEYEYKE